MKRAVTHLLAAIAALPILLSVAAAGPPGHPVRIGVLGMTSPSFDPAENAFARELIDESRNELGENAIVGRRVDDEVVQIDQPVLEDAHHLQHDRGALGIILRRLEKHAESLLQIAVFVIVEPCARV